jgi:hypothetical protein
MITVTALWLPILLSAILVFFASSIIHMVLPHHKSDYKKLPKEDQALEEIGKIGVPPGEYAFPFPEDRKSMNSPEMIKKYNEGPVGMLTVLPSRPPAMGKSLIIWFIYSVVIGIFTAYITGRTLAANAPYLTVFRIAATTAFMAYAFAHTHKAIWEGRSWGTTIKYYFDGLIYGLLTAGTFAGLWPNG